MLLTALGTAAGIGRGVATTSFLVDETTLIDCGSGVGSLGVEQLEKIERVLLTHSHLDHCGFIPFLADCHAYRDGPGVTVYSQPETLAALRAHLFSGVLWPDYTRLPDPAKPWVRLEEITVGEKVQLENGTATALPAAHSVPGIGWLITGPKNAFAFTGDTGPCPAFWEAVSRVATLSDIVSEISYRNKDSANAERFGHLSAEKLAPLLDGLPDGMRLWISHLEPGRETEMMAEIRATLPSRLKVDAIRSGQTIVL
ncbi:3',5'-cyclic-nucleotide phosphodiesterase [Crenobacter cavernae]|uniref:3',5'-cyclic-nucleotide phosphodiesterase n=1 Tax=Crenobacter cavernae TaxID=2290923 RepID=A0A345Y9V8_9NEIS|nr:3',5'-cyclic-nucleotide phosphodiesterase [Crenobacter cavernae]AXK40710.1 3',5'-cyclic-nucleotide phosphodiesterase [Crenobacter cavernae]